MTEENIKELKQKIRDGWALAHDPVCSEGFSAADAYISYLEMQTESLKTCLNEILIDIETSVNFVMKM